LQPWIERLRVDVSADANNAWPLGARCETRSGKLNDGGESEGPHRPTAPPIETGQSAVRSATARRRRHDHLAFPPVHPDRVALDSPRPESFRSVSGFGTSAAAFLPVQNGPETVGLD
jgi:hypothetical protein